MIKKFIIKSAILVLPFIVIFIVMELALENIPNDYTYKKNYLDENADQIETLIMGSSTLYYGLDPVYFNSKTFNGCHISQSLDYNYAIFLKYLPQLTHLKTLILPLSEVDLPFRLIDSKEAWRTKSYVLYYRITIPPKEYATELFSQKATINLKRLYAYYIKKHSEKTSSDLGWGMDYHSGNAQDLEQTAIAATRRHADINPEIIKDNISILKSMIKICKERSVKVILIDPPVFETYRKNVPKEKLDAITQATIELNVLKDDYVYLDLFDDRRFMDEDFFDADHLNEKGAKKLSLIVNQVVNTQ